MERKLLLVIACLILAVTSYCQTPSAPPLAAGSASSSETTSPEFAATPNEQYPEADTRIRIMPVRWAQLKCAVDGFYATGVPMVGLLDGYRVPAGQANG